MEVLINKYKNKVEDNKREYDLIKNRLQSIQNIKQDFKELLDEEDVRIIDNEINKYCEQEENILKDKRKYENLLTKLKTLFVYSENDDISSDDDDNSLHCKIKVNDKFNTPLNSKLSYFMK